MGPVHLALRRLLWRPFRVVAIDDHRSWRGIHLYLGALHLASIIEKATDNQKVGIMLPTSGFFSMSLLATWMLGRTVVPLNYLLSEKERAYICEDAGLDTVITVGQMIEAVGDLPASIKQIRLEDESFKGLPKFRRAARMPDDAKAVILYTSGTSGKPKGVVLTSKNIAANVMQCVEWAELNRQIVFLGLLPQFHSFGFTVMTVLPLMVGCRVVYSARFQPSRVLGLIRKHKPTAMFAIPSMFNALLAAKDAKPDDFEHFIYLVSGGEPLPEAVSEGYQKRFGVTIDQGYGLTETAPVTNWCRPQDRRKGSVGQALPRVEERIVDTNEVVLGPNEDGEIRIKGPNVMQGYYKLPDETASVFDGDGFFKTGDMGRIDDDGHLYITGRIKEMLIIGGENVFPREIEEVLNAHPDVHDCAVIGQQDPNRGEVPLAFVELLDGAVFDSMAIRKFCRNGLPQFKVPREIRRVESLPRNPTGKIMRRMLSPDTPCIESGVANS
ncbi:MAG: AMP-binding protein [Phycisphaerales bacterium]|nr:AMP-binding protein [Phycisphaerales bacterium]